MKYDIQADWVITPFCNFKCKYCCSGIPKKKHFPPFVNNEKIVNGFKKSGLVWLLNMGAMEPFFQPHFVELCKKLTEENCISVNTNLSPKNVKDFAMQINPEKVSFVHCSLHFEERERLKLVNDFTEKVTCLKEQGFNVFVTQVMYPPLVKRFDKISNLFLEKEIVIKPKIFRGYYHGKHYPESYSTHEREIIAKHFMSSDDSKKLPRTLIDPDLDKHFLYGELSFQGSLCNAGKDFVIIEQNGDVFRCWGEPTKLGNVYENTVNLFKEPRPCSSGVCPCPYHGLRFTDGRYKIVKNDGFIARTRKKFS